MNAFEDLKWRGAIYDATPGSESLLGNEKTTVYCGFDPTAKSLHIGNLVPVMGLMRLQRHGHTPIALVGGGTGMIGDPSGKSAERPLLTTSEIEGNVYAVREQLGRFLDFEAETNPARVVNNANWLMDTSAIEFMRDVGKHFTVNRMLTRESVKNRLQREDGISYTEFSYMLLQAYDFQVLHDRYGCKMQIGGSDQWGNLLGGVDLIRRTRSVEAQALVYPLITTATGEKFGKSVGGAPALDPEVTSPFKLYQFFLNTADADVVPYLKLFSFLTEEEIAEISVMTEERPKERAGQRRLAREVTELVHGVTGLQAAEAASEVLFGGEVSGLTASELHDIFSDVPSSDMAKSALEGTGMPLPKLLAEVGVAKSAGEARRLTEQGGIYLNNHRENDVSRAVTLEDAIEGKVIVLRRGARDFHLVELV
jgi:tyrosyl-tRNA synthetase